MGWDSVVGIATRYELNWMIWDRIPVVAKLSATVQSGPAAHPASRKMGTGSFSPGVKRPGRGADYLTKSRAEVQERSKLCFYFPSGPAWLVLGRNLLNSVSWERLREHVSLMNKFINFKLIKIFNAVTVTEHNPCLTIDVRNSHCSIILPPNY